MDNRSHGRAHFTSAVGDRAELRTNVYPLFQSRDITHYSVTADPPIPSNEIQALVRAAFCPGEDLVSDDNTLNSLVIDGDGQLFSSLGNLVGEFSVAKRDGDGCVHLSIAKVQDVSKTDHGLLVHIYRQLFRRAHLAAGLQQFGRAWLDFSQSRSWGTFCLLDGFLPSVEVLSCGPSYVVDVTTRVDRNVTVYDFIRPGVANAGQRSALLSALQQLQISTSYGSRRRLVRVASVDWEADTTTTYFEKIVAGEAVKVSIADYFRERYEFEVQKADPVITTEAGRRLELLPASALRLIGLTETERRSEDVVKQIRSLSFMNPENLKNKVDDFVSVIAASKVLDAWGVNVKPAMVVAGHVLPPPVLTFGSRRQGHDFVEVVASRKSTVANEMKNAGVAVPPGMNARPIFLTQEGCAEDVRSLLMPTFLRVAKQMGIVLQDPEIRVVANTQGKVYTKEIISYVQTYGAPSFVVAVFLSTNQERYDAVKQLLTVELGIPSQFVRSTTLFGENVDMANICVNLLLQITAKTGGIPFFCTPETLPLMHTMIIGISTCRGSSPVCAMTSSYDSTLVRYKSATFRMNDGKILPIVTDLVTKAVDRYTRQMREAPKCVVIFRDGDTDNDEINAYRESLRESSLLVISVHRSPHTRLIRDDVTGSNPIPGTIVSEQVTGTETPEFLLVSHEASPDHATIPTRYTIAHHFPPVWKDEHIAQLTYYLACQYPSCTGSIKVPSAVLLASKLAELSSHILTGSCPHDSLSDFMHFL